MGECFGVAQRFSAAIKAFSQKWALAPEVFSARLSIFGRLDFTKRSNPKISKTDMYTGFRSN